MKKIIILSLLVLCFSVTFVGADAFGGVGNALSIVEGASDVVGIVKGGENTGYCEINNLVATRPLDQDPDDFYNKNKKGSWGPACANLLLGFGLGSKWQNDESASLLQLTIDGIALGGSFGVAITSISTGFFYTLFNAAYQSEHDDSYDFENGGWKDDPFVSVAVYSVIAGVGISLVNRIVGVVSAFTFARDYNNALKNQLNLSVVPNLADKSVSIVAKVGLS